MQEEVLEKLFFTRVPKPKTIPTMTAAIAAMSRPYSTAEAPSSERVMVLRIRFIM
jgi:hypothetical protein